jgi:hypothetical protein
MLVVAKEQANKSCEGKKFCLCGKCLRCGHCGIRREMFSNGIEYWEHILYCPERQNKNGGTK